MIDRSEVVEKRVDSNATWLNTHPDVVKGFPTASTFHPTIEDDFPNCTYNQDMLADISSLQISEDVWLVWWKHIFVGQFEQLYFINGEGVMELLNQEFWEAFIVGDKPKNTDYACIGDMKIRVSPEYCDWLCENFPEKDLVNYFEEQSYPKVGNSND